MKAKLAKKVFINGTIEAVTGLSIGGSSIGLTIGGVDKVVLRNPINNQPYIPGSSLKGKMRSLLEKMEGRMKIKIEAKGKNEKGEMQVKRTEDYDSTDQIPKEALIKQEGEEKIDIKAMPCRCGECLICQVFGVPAEEEKPLGRLVVRDAELANPDLLEKSKNTDMPFTEVKTEVVIDRITSGATPRNFERVPAEAIFNLRLVCNIYEGDDDNQIINQVLKGLKLVQDDYLGGSGSRGYGEVKFHLLEKEMTFKDKAAYENDAPARPVTGITIPQELK